MKKSAKRPRPNSNQLAQIQIPGELKLFSKFDGWWLYSPSTYIPQIFSIKRSKPFKIYIENQEASNILRVGFSLSKWPHLQRAYLVTVRNQNFIAVYQNHSVELVLFFSWCKKSSQEKNSQGCKIHRQLSFGVLQAGARKV